MKSKSNQAGFAHIGIVLIIIVVLGTIGYGFYRVKNNQTKPVSKTAGESQPSPDKKNAEPYEKADFKNDELGLSFSYPKEWGTATIAKGTFTESYQQGNYQQVTFSKNDKVDINFVLGSYSSPLDGCGITEPVKAEKYSLSQQRGSKIGWEGDNIKGYHFGQGMDKPAVVLTNIKPGDTGPGWVKVEVKGNTLAYKNLVNPETVYKATEPDDFCTEKITQQVADEANAYSKYVHFVANFSSSKVFGVNAQYDARNIKDPSAETAKIISVLNSIK